jgi:hypothetical protein
MIRPQIHGGTMQFVSGTLLVALAAIHAESDARQEQLFASWQEAQRTIKSLVVQFTLETRDIVSKRGQPKAEGVFRLIRTPDGKLFASYQLTQPEGSDWPGRWTGLLNDGSVYLLVDDKKTAFGMKPNDDDLRQFLEKHFNPFVLLLDKKYAKDKCYLEVVKQDEWYTYLSVTPKNVKRYGWNIDSFQGGRVVLINKSSERVPKDMPRELRYTDGFNEYVYDIKSWRFNAPKAPKLEEFARPEDRPAWKVGDWPFVSNKKPAQ